MAEKNKQLSAEQKKLQQQFRGRGFFQQSVGSAQLSAMPHCKNVGGGLGGDELPPPHPLSRDKGKQKVLA
jgi:hypothetical protein